jgi:hypothetical protein
MPARARRSPDRDDGRVIPGAVPDRAPVIGVVPVVHDDPDAPGGCAALRELGGMTLLRRAVDRLVGSGRVDRVTVCFGARCLCTVCFGTVPPDARPGAGRSAEAPSGLVVVHDPLHALAPASLVRDVVDELLAHQEADGILPVRPVTDTLKRTGPDGVVTGTADREAFHVVGSPQVYRAAVLARVDGWGAPALGPGDLPVLVRAAGGRLRTVPAPGEVFPVTTDDDLVLAEAVLADG